MTHWNTYIEAHMVFFHSESYNADVHLLAYSFDENFESCLEFLIEYLSSVFGDPYNVVSTVKCCVGRFAIFHVVFSSKCFTLYLTA
jgi:hypothetical protein